MYGCSTVTRFSERGKTRRLSHLVRIYIAKWRKKARRELRSFRTEGFVSAVERAALAVHDGEDRKRKRFSHQRRLKLRALNKAREVLLISSPKLRRAKAFDDLHEAIKESLRGIAGLGSLYYYDTALRIGANLRKMPERVYLHRGTRRGARAMRLDWRADSLDLKCLPSELWVLKPHEIEDFLCIFAKHLGRVRTGVRLHV
jgi:hypothetical protein